MILDWIFQSSGDRILKKLQPIIEKINSLEESVSKMTREEMLEKIEKFKIDVQHKVLTLDDILPEVFAMVREAGKRTIGKRHYDVQLIGGCIIHKGMVAEMKTGEGKTLVATLPAILNAITGRSVFVITVNEYLVKRDCEILKPIYEYLGFSASYVNSTCNQYVKKAAYSSNIVYVTNHEVCFDYLRANMAEKIEEKMFHDLHFAIIDEMDYVLIDESRTPLIISGPDNENSDLYEMINPVIYKLSENDYKVDLKSKTAAFENSGFDILEKYLTEKGLINNDLFSENIGVYHVALNLLKAHKVMSKDKDYVVFKDEVVIVDEHTGRLAIGRKFSNGLHQALEAKEGVPVRKGSKTNAFISYTNFFRLFDKIGGMTGTGKPDSDEFEEVYNLFVVKVPTNRPVIRKDDNIIKLYHTKQDMYEDALVIIKEKHSKGQPLLLCTPSVHDSQILSEVLSAENLNHLVLNAINHEKEASIVSQAGKSFAITIATNMAGRGTDVILGGCIESAVKDMLKNNPDFDVEKFEKEMTPLFKEDRKVVEQAGGLCVLILGALECEKSVIQFIGRAGRQGDPGESMLFVSLEDDLLFPLFRDALNRMLISLFFRHKCNTNGRAQALVKDIQEMYQSYFFEIRRNTLKYDDVINLQRKAVYSFRDYIMTTTNIQGLIEKILVLGVRDICEKHLKKANWKEIIKPRIDEYIEDDFNSIQDINARIIEKFCKNIEEKRDEDMRESLLGIFDEKWYEQINELENLKRTIFLVGYAQKDPVFEFRKSSFNLFMDMIKEFRLAVLDEFIRNSSRLDFDYNSMFGDFQSAPCFCGSGKIFKECHGQSVLSNFQESDMGNLFNDFLQNMQVEDGDVNKPETSEEDNNTDFMNLLQNIEKNLNNKHFDLRNENDEDEDGDDLDDDDNFEAMEKISDKQEITKNEKETIKSAEHKNLKQNIKKQKIDKDFNKPQKNKPLKTFNKLKTTPKSNIKEGIKKQDKPPKKPNKPQVISFKDTQNNSDDE